LREWLIRIWARSPAIIRAPIVAFIVFTIGSTATVLPLFGNIKFYPQIPWALPATLIVVAVFWFYFTGGGYPASTRAARERVTRGKFLPAPVWRAAIIPMALSLVAIASLRLALPSLLPVDAPKIALDLSAYPTATVIGLLLSIAISAGVVEEVAFRGYLQKPLEESYGPVAAILITGIAFWYVHDDKVSVTHLPFHMTASILLGLMTYMTRSLLPAIAGHTLMDAILQPAYAFREPSFMWSALTAKPVWTSVPHPGVAEKFAAIGKAMEPSQIFAAGPMQVFAITAWVFLISTTLALLTLIPLSRTVRESAQQDTVARAAAI
jgi:membrane protease YdiL (CAAX protease family)